MSEGNVPMWWEPDSNATVNSERPMWIMASELCLIKEKIITINKYFKQQTAIENDVVKPMTFRLLVQTLYH